MRNRRGYQGRKSYGRKSYGRKGYGKRSKVSRTYYMSRGGIRL